jgi:hypothetical protein
MPICPLAGFPRLKGADEERTLAAPKGHRRKLIQVTRVPALDTPRQVECGGGPQLPLSNLPKGQSLPKNTPSG